MEKTCHDLRVGAKAGKKIDILEALGSGMTRKTSKDLVVVEEAIIRSQVLG